MNRFEYTRAGTVQEAVQVLAADPAARFIAGGTNLLDLMKLQIETPTHLVDVNRLPLDRIEATSDGGLRIGAMVRNSDLAADERVRRILTQQKFAGAMVSILDALLKLRQACNDPRLLEPPGPAELAGPDIGACEGAGVKLGWLRETLPTMVAEGRRILVFSQFTRMLRLVEPELRALGLTWLRLTGDTATADRGSRVAQFQRGEAPVFLVSLKAGGVGLNLTAADTVIHLDPWWNPAVEQQASARAHRIGQHKPVTVYRLVVAGSIEERLLGLQARKAALAEAVLGPGAEAGTTARFDLAELQALLAPLQEAGD